MSRQETPRQLPPSAAPDDPTQVRFAALQRSLIDQWRLIGGFNTHAQTMVVVPSLSLEVDLPGTLLQAYEERMLFLLLLLRKPKARIIYLSSRSILPEIIDYYLGLLPGLIPSHARRRLILVPVQDSSSRPLTRKILDRPSLLARLRALILDPASTHLVPFNTTVLERDLALQLGIPMFGADPAHLSFGTKSGCRRLFREEGVSCPLGREDLRSLEEVVAAIRELRRLRPGLQRVMVKHNQGVSGMGNAEVDLDGLPAVGAGGETEAIRQAVLAMRLEVPSLSAAGFLDRLAAEGGVVEERILAATVRSPSVQMRLTPIGEVEVVSTHDQLLGGPGGQSFLGSRFPADPDYADPITREAAKIGDRLRREGALGRVAIDFVVSKTGEEDWQAHAIEINLRKGGTTTPLLILEFLTQGRYDPETGRFSAPSGRRKCYVSSDHVESEAFRDLTVEEVFDIVVRAQLHFNQATQTGIVLHLLSAVTELGRLGITAVGDSPAEAEALYQRMLAALEEGCPRQADAM